MNRSTAGRLNRRTILKGTGAFAIAATAAARIFGAPAVLAQPRKLEKMSIFIGTTPHFGNVIVGDKKGFYEKQGLPVEITYFASGSVATDAFRAGRGNMVVAGDLPTIRIWNQGAIGICPQANYSELSIIVARNNIRSAQDMRGKKVGVLIGSTSEFFAKLYLNKGGVDVKQVDLINLRPAEMVTGLARGDIDAFVIWQPFGWRALQAVRDAHILTTGKGYFHEWEACSVTKDFATQHEAEIIAFLKGFDAAGKWIKENPDEAAKIVADAIRLDDTKVAKDMLALIDWNIAFTPKFRHDMDFVSEFINIKIDWKTMFEPKFLAKVNPGYVS